MYLAISREKTNNYLKAELAKLNIEVAALPCLWTYPDRVALECLRQQINNFNIIIITSPAAIDYAAAVVKLANSGQIFIVPGLSSFTRLRQYTKNEIYMPHNASGAEAIVTQVLERMDLNAQKIVILCSLVANHQIQDYLVASYGINAYTQMPLYRQEWLDLDAQFLKKSLTNKRLHGIILTSSSHAQYLFSQAHKFGYYDMLLQVNFIVLHPKIEQILLNLGVKRIYLSATASLVSLVDFIGKLHDRRQQHHIPTGEASGS